MPSDVDCSQPQTPKYSGPSMSTERACKQNEGETQDKREMGLGLFMNGGTAQAF